MSVWQLVVRHTDGKVVIAVSGELDIATRPDLAECVNSVIDAYRGPVELDLRDITFIDAHGLGGLISMKRRATDRLLLVGAPPPLRNILQLTHLSLGI